MMNLVCLFGHKWNGCKCQRCGKELHKSMNKKISCVVILLMVLSLFSCESVNKRTGEPFTAIALGMTLEQAKECEPELTVESDNRGCSIIKEYAGAEGELKIYLGIDDPGKLDKVLDDEETTVISIIWAIDPTDRTGKTVYDELFSDLKRIHGRPKRSVDNKDVEGITGIYDQANSIWEYEKYEVSCSYIEYKESGKCQVMFRMSTKINALW